MKTVEQEKARALRAQGWSVKEIERELGVARSSVSRWVRDISLSPEQRQRLVDKVGLAVVVAAERKSARARAQRAEYQEAGRALVKSADSSYTAGCMLFWAEGSKNKNAVQLTNSDPELCACFVEFLRRHFNVADDKFAVTCNLFADHLRRQREIEDYWLATLRLPRTSLKKSIVNTYSKYSKKKRTNKLPYGTCRVTVCSTKIVQTIYGSIQEYGGFDRPEWLD